MKRGLLCTLVVVVGALAAVRTVSAGAQTTANGPYYATPSWDQTLPASTRFIVLSNMGSAAVLDRETGLIWEKSPNAQNKFTWGVAKIYCNQLRLGNRVGWRLPTIQELGSLMDPSVSAPSLPAGHPFSNVQISSPYWSATTSDEDASLAWDVFFSSHGVSPFDFKGESFFVWCVRGGHGTDAQ